jgi:hypothetical protein
MIAPEHIGARVVHATSKCVAARQELCHVRENARKPKRVQSNQTSRLPLSMTTRRQHSTADLHCKNFYQRDRLSATAFRHGDDSQVPAWTPGPRQYHSVPDARLALSGTDVQVRNLERNPHLAKSIGDAGWAAFRAILTSTAAYAGKWVVAVPPAFTSQDCGGVLPNGSRCTQRVATTLSVRTHFCRCCGLVLDRDENAALTILRAGQAPQARTRPAGPSVASAALALRRGELHG